MPSTVFSHTCTNVVLCSMRCKATSCLLGSPSYLYWQFSMGRERRCSPVLNHKHCWELHKRRQISRCNYESWRHWDYTETAGADSLSCNTIAHVLHELHKGRRQKRLWCTWQWLLFLLLLLFFQTIHNTVIVLSLCSCHCMVLHFSMGLIQRKLPPKCNLKDTMVEPWLQENEQKDWEHMASHLHMVQNGMPPG